MSLKPPGAGNSPVTRTNVLNAQDYGARGDGTTDDTAALQAAINAGAGGVVYIPAVPAYYRTTQPIIVPARTVVDGAFGGGYWERPGQGTTVVRKVNGDSGGDSVFIAGEDCAFKNLQVEGPTQVHYLASIYPSGTQNPSYGIRSAYTDGAFVDSAGGVQFENVTARYFSKAGIGGNYDVAQVRFCHLHQNLYGIDWAGSDCLVVGSHLNHNVHSGMRTTQNFNQVIGNRIEWNGRYGFTSATGEHVINGNIFDRNGWPGVFLDAGSWHNTITGNKFARNACGGDSAYGRAGEVTTTATDPAGNKMYLEPGGTGTVGSGDNFQKAHLSLYFAKYTIVTGNQFRTGTDDAGAGAAAPKYCYAFKDIDTATVGLNHDQNGWQGSEAGTAYREGAGARRYTTGSVAVADTLTSGQAFQFEKLQVVAGGTWGLPGGTVGSTPGGWVAGTGTATRSTFVTGSVTLPALAEHVKALVDDLLARGVIGA